MNTTSVIAPLLSVNEPQAQVVEICVQPGQLISAGDLLCVLATTKASFDVEAELSGYIHQAFILEGQTIDAGQVMFEIGPEPPQPVQPHIARSLPAPQPPAGVRITQKALALATQMNIDLNQFAQSALITEAMVQTLIRTASPPALSTCDVLIYGAGGHARTIIDLLRQSHQFRIAGVIADPAPFEEELLGVPILGGSDALPALHAKGLRLIVNAVGSIDRPCVRAEIFDRLAQQGFSFPALVHRSAVVEPSASIAAGAQIFGTAFIGSAAGIGFGAIVNTGAIVSHDCVVAEYAHITPGAVLAGGVKVGAGALIGMGVTTNRDVSIGEWSRIGNGARIHADVPPRAVVPSGTTWPPGKS